MSINSITTNDKYSYMDERSIHPVLKCKLCTRPFVDPVTTQTKDTYCRACILSIINRGRNQDSARVMQLTPVTEKLVLDMLDSLLVRCTKCGESNIMRGQLDEHENRACMQASVVCIAADLKCPWVGTRDELDDHLGQCQFQPLRSALGCIFIDHDQFKTRLENLERECDQLLNVRKMGEINFD